MSQKQQMLLIPDDVVMSDFCYSYAKALFIKLERLMGDDKVFAKGYELASPKGWNEITPIANCVIAKLSEQIGFKPSERTHRNEVDLLLTTAAEFLNIFGKLE